jgi:hypothetical protein
MRNLNGIVEISVSRNTETPLGLGVNHRRNIGLGLAWLTLPFLSGCAALKKTALVAGASSIGAGVGSVLSGTVGSIAGAATGATAGVIATGLGEPKEVISQPLELTAETVVTHAPTNLWDVVSQLGLWAGLIILIPLVLGILLPGPVQFKKK